jgi:hypothetical protein
VGNPRINLEGEVVGEVTEEEVKLFWDNRKKQRKSQQSPKSTFDKKPPEKQGQKSVRDKAPVSPKRSILKLKKSGAIMSNNQAARIEVQSLKATLPLKPAQVPRDILPPEGTPGGAKMKVFWGLVLAEKQVYRVGFSVKNYRKCLKTLDQHEAAGSECIILLQGKLVNGGLIEDAGLSVQVKTPIDKREDMA